MRLKFNRTKYDATLLTLTMVSVWGAVAWLMVVLLLQIKQ